MSLYIPMSDDIQHEPMSEQAILDAEEMLNDPMRLNFEEMSDYIREHLPRNDS